MDRMDGMDGWMDGWIDEWIDGWIDGWMDGWMVIDGGWIDVRNTEITCIRLYK